ncbi:MAG: enoyl-CoA hydratase [Deltaproteobacteria bacterium]|nr:enoyl-CoA hydratase [Deltaproteobacteria bacterium]
MADKDLLFEKRDGAAWLVLNREEHRNSISVEALDLFNEYLDAIEADQGIRVTCITGAGDKAFSSGADLGTAMGGHGVDGPMKYAGLIERMGRFPKPFIARVNGHCMAGGMGLMLACDMVYAHEDVLFGTPEVKVGLFPMMISALILRNMPRKKAMEMMFTGRRFTAREAEEIGLVTRCVGRDELDRVVDEAVASIVANAPLAISAGRQAMAEIEALDLEDSIPFLHRRLLALLNTEDASEGLAAFLQKRKPEWRGR